MCDRVKVCISVYNEHIHLQTLRGDPGPSASTCGMNLQLLKSMKSSLFPALHHQDRHGEVATCAQESLLRTGAVLASEGQGAPAPSMDAFHSPSQISGEKMVDSGHQVDNLSCNYITLCKIPPSPLGNRGR